MAYASEPHRYGYKYRTVLARIVGRRDTTLRDVARTTINRTETVDKDKLYQIPSRDDYKLATLPKTRSDVLL